MRLHADCATRALDEEPTAPLVGPFPRRGYLEAWWSHRSTGQLVLAEHDGMVLPLHRVDDTVEIVGEPDLTDYHSPLGGSFGTLPGFGKALVGALPGAGFRFDSLPGEVALPLQEGLIAGGATVGSEQHETAAIVDLPDEYDTYLAALRSKDRHEIRRKGRRFVEALGEARLVDGSDGFETFVSMHRAATGRKGDFMDDAFEAFFRDLLGLEGAVVSLLMGGDTPVAAAFGFEDDDAYYLYNSAYDPAFAAASPGVVLVDRLLALSIRRGKRRFDFLKGDESYKYKMGATARPLWVLAGEFPR